MHTQILSPAISEKILSIFKESNFPMVYNREKHSVTLQDDTYNDWVHFRLPITFPPVDKSDVEDEEHTVSYLVLLIQSGQCAMGYFEDGVNIEHKVFRAYMVRKKQGKSQIKYLKTKGKSRAGSRVRLGETYEFFDNINKRLQEYFKDYEIDRIALSCSKTLIPFLYNAKAPTPFDKKDERIFKIPKHVHTPTLEVMMEVNEFLLKGELIYEEQHQELVQQLLFPIRNSTFKA